MPVFFVVVFFIILFSQNLDNCIRSDLKYSTVVISKIERVQGSRTYIRILFLNAIKAESELG